MGSEALRSQKCGQNGYFFDCDAWHLSKVFSLQPSVMLKGEFVTSGRNEKNMKVCAQNTSTTIYNLFSNKF